jgi:putative ABC transport system permease protein
MWKNYLTIAWRTIMRHRGYAILNVLGLALGLCACIVIFLISHYELSFDTFHPDRERIYRVMTGYTEATGNRAEFGTVPLPGVRMLQGSLSGAEAIAAVQPWWGVPISVPRKDIAALKFDSRPAAGGYPPVVLAQPSWFSIFHYDLLAGKVSTEPYTVVLTESRAHQYFGPGPLTGMLGRVIRYDSLPVHVSGIVRDWQGNTDLRFTDLVSFSTVNSSYFNNNFDQRSWQPDGQLLLTFVKLGKARSPQSVQTRMASLVRSHADPGLKMDLELDPLADLHFKDNVIECPVRTAHMPTLYALMGIALFILLIAAINFVNLSTAQSLQRAREVGVRKVLGGSRTSLMIQFLTETFVLCVFAGVLAAALVNPVLTAFRSFLPPGLVFQPYQPSFVVFLSLIMLITAFLAGFYPARVLSAYLPVLTLKGSGSSRGSGKWYLRKGLIVFQFAVSLVFIIGSIVIASQLNYARHKDLGFNSDAIVTIDTPGSDSLSNVRTVAEAMQHVAGVSQVALQWAGPGTPAGMSIRFTGTLGKEIRAAQVDGDENLIPLYRLKLIAGRDLSHADSVNEFVINETLAKLMGCRRPEQALGKTIFWLNKPYPVVGVVADFHPGSLHQPIPPLCIINRVERERTVVVKLGTGGKETPAIKDLLARLEKTWKAIYPAEAFSYRFYDETLARAYEKDQQTGRLMNTATGITIFICCIGLFGLAMFSAETRTREIGIRKVLGASVAHITILLTRDIVLLIALATVIASPVAWYFMHGWLQGFAYRINLGWWVFLVGGLSAMLIGLAAVSYQALKAALRNPVDSLRTD